MKKSLPHVLSIAAIILVCFSCKPEVVVTAPTLTEKDTIDLATYNSYVDGWKVKGQGFTDTMLLQYFTMPLVDLREFGNQPSTAARFVLGMDTTVYPMEAHLMLVSTDSKFEPILPPNANIYDFTTPCPRVCYPPEEK